jgi:hypothetical protein
MPCFPRGLFAKEAADDVARRIRELDTEIQRTNREVELLDE